MKYPDCNHAMNEAHLHYLYGSFPSIFCSPIGQTRIECGDGWFELIIDVARKLAQIDDLYIVSMRAEFGVLRFAWTSRGMPSRVESDRINSLYYEAEEKSKTICEWCGDRKATLRQLPQGGVRTLCADCLLKTVFEAPLAG